MKLTRTYKGLICIHDGAEGGEELVYLSSVREPLVVALRWMSRRNVTVRYWVTEKECSKEEAQEDFIRTLTGCADVLFGARYSEITGYLWTDQELKVGGHDLIAEIASYEGEWLILEVEFDD